MRCFALCALFLSSLAVSTVMVAQEPASKPEPGNAVCTFADDKQMSMRYERPSAGKKDELPIGKLWEPGDSPMHLFAETPLMVGNTEIAVGAYSVYFIPGKSDWTMIVNRNVAADSKYDQQQDLVRAPMETGKLPQAEPQLTVYFARLGPKQCNMRVDFGKVRAWVDFNEK
ncbi:MAG: DUF2911 domain-containing protein [Acidobacteriia bacterium]|nr:DUF2911 domain-containing protein [Terriglobia bacterium]